MKRITLIIFSIITFTIFIFSINPEKKFLKVRVIDGDTIEINNEKIRFGGINSPERKEVGYKLAKDKLKEKISSDIVTCVREKNKDRYRRTVAECFVEEESLSRFMVKGGYACDYVYYSKGKYAKEQLYAKVNKLGIWKMGYNSSWENKCRKK